MMVLLVLLLALEYIYWLSPLAPRLAKLTDRLGTWYLLVPYHYLIRLIALGAVLLVWRPALWPVFAGGARWAYSLLWGLVIAAVSLLLFRKTSGPGFWAGALRYHREKGWRAAAHTAYLIVYPGFVEELLFRWFFPALLWPMLGYGVLAAGPVLNLIWHLPVWWDYAAQQQSRRKGAALAAVALPAMLFAVVLTVLAVFTHNLAGPVLAHAFADWAGSVDRHRSRSAA